jgi:hypothetical protein
MAARRRTWCFTPRLDVLGFEVAAFMHECDDEDLVIAQVIEDAPGIGWNLAHLLVVEFGDFAAAEGRGLDAVGTAPNLARASLAGDHAAGVDIPYPLMNLVEYKEPIDDLIEWGVIGQPLDGLDGLLFSGVACIGSPAPTIVRAVTRYRAFDDKALLGSRDL